MDILALHSVVRGSTRRTVKLPRDSGLAAPGAQRLLSPRPRLAPHVGTLAAVGLLCLLAWGGLGRTAMAQEPPASERIVSEDYKVSLERPAGWTFVDVSDGAVCAFIDNAGKGAKIELRASPRVTGGMKATYLGAFRHGLEGAFVAEGEPRKARYGALDGQEMTFVARNGGERIVAFAFFRKQIAYLLVGYFPTATFDTMVPTFEKVIQTIGFTK